MALSTDYMLRETMEAFRAAAEHGVLKISIEMRMSIDLL